MCLYTNGTTRPDAQEEPCLAKVSALCRRLDKMTELLFYSFEYKHGGSHLVTQAREIGPYRNHGRRPDDAAVVIHEVDRSNGKVPIDVRIGR